MPRILPGTQIGPFILLVREVDEKTEKAQPPWKNGSKTAIDKEMLTYYILLVYLLMKYGVTIYRLEFVFCSCNVFIKTAFQAGCQA